VKPGETWPDRNDRGWRAKRDYTAQQLSARRENIRSKASGQKVETFVADEWTLEYDLARAGLAQEVFIAVRLAIADERIGTGKVKRYTVMRQALRDFDKLTHEHTNAEELATYIYKPFLSESRLSKATAAQYLASILQSRNRRGQITEKNLELCCRAISLPPSNT